MMHQFQHLNLFRLFTGYWLTMDAFHLGSRMQHAYLTSFITAVELYWLISIGNGSPMSIHYGKLLWRHSITARFSFPTSYNYYRYYGAKDYHIGTI